MSARPRPDTETETARRPGPTRALAHTLARLFTHLGVIVMFSVSAMLLLRLGVPYGSPGGSQLMKIHPGTYLIVFAGMLFLVSRGFVPVVAALWRDRPGILVYAIAIGILMFQCVAIQHRPLSALIDTFLSSLMMVLALTSIGARDKRFIALFIHGFFLVNSFFGYVEQVTSFRVTPPIIDGKVATFEWRSTALLGHPLTNAAQTGLYLVLLSGPAGRIFDTRIRMLLVLFHLGAMSCFGGRTSTVLVIAVLALRSLTSGLTLMGGSRIRRTTAVAFAAVATAAMLSAVVLADLGAFDKFLGRFQEDSGSARTRVAMLHVFDRLTPEAVVLAPPPEEIAAAQRRLDITTAIESFVVAFPAYYGSLVTVLFFAGLACFLGEVIRLVGRAALLPIGFWLAVNAGANGISTKTLDLTLAVTSVTVLNAVGAAAVPARSPPRPAAPARPAPPAAPVPATASVPAAATGRRRWLREDAIA